VRDRGRTDEQAALADAIVADLKAQRALTGPRRLLSIFFGGGTPSLMDPAQVARVIETAKALWTPADDLEISLEANPTDAETDRFEALAAAGVARLSLGVQALDDEALKLLGRNHDAGSARRAIAVAARAFPRLSADLIYARPGQTVEAWTAELDRTAGLRGPSTSRPTS
jgi:coproporphyrinogen III oxidase-like Fe-S oxidoreductase